LHPHLLRPGRRLLTAQTSKLLKTEISIKTIAAVRSQCR
jgi:hypothetical protein